MRGSSPFSSSVTSVLVHVGTCSLLVLIVVLITGGFVLDAGPLHFSSHRWQAPLAVAAMAWFAAAAIGGVRGLVDNLSVLPATLDRYAPQLAVLIAASAAAIGIGMGTYAASASDASGYVSQAELIATGRIIRDEPLARELTWPDGGATLSPLGYRPGPMPGEQVPTYPPGLPLAMAAVRPFGGEWAPFFVVPLLGALAVFWTYLLGARVHSRRAGLVAAALLTTSPVFLFQIVQPMSDVPSVAWWTLAVLLALSSQPLGPVAAGAAAGVALLTRPNLLPLVPVVALIAGRWLPGLRPRPPQPLIRVCSFAAGLIPAAGALALLQWRLYGSPLAAGHGPVEQFFSASNVWPNVLDYADRLVRGELPALYIGVVSLIVLVVTRKWRSRSESISLAPAAWLAAAVTTALLVCYLPYLVFPDWSYLRFFLPAFPLGFILAGALAVEAGQAMPRPARGVLLLAAITAAGAVNIGVANLEHAFNLRRYEGRYRQAGRYLDAVLPPDAVVFAMQESGSVRHYTQRPIVRFDVLPIELDAAVAMLAAAGRTPVVVIEDWEEPGLRARFPASNVARLDWPPRADIGNETRVRLYDPADRTRPTDAIRTDRFR